MPVKQEKKRNEDLKKKIEKDIGEFKIGWATFPIIFVPELKDDSGARLDGYTTFSPYLIQIHDNLGREGIIETLVHETLHVIAATVGLDISEDEDAEITIKNEELVTRMSRGLILAHKLNSELWKVMYQDE